MCSILKEVVVCSCNVLFDFFVSRAVSAALHNPNLGARCHRGHNSAYHHLAPQRKLRLINLKNEALEISEVGGPLKEKCSYITVTLGPFESKVLTHYSCCWGAL